jgi:hypothetical protein
VQNKSLCGVIKLQILESYENYIRASECRKWKFVVSGYVEGNVDLNGTNIF